MAGITNGRPDLAVGEPIHLGDNFKIEQHPVSDRLIIRDTASGKVAYVRAERGGEIGGDGVLIKALKESKPMADDGRTYDTIQEAERAASSWVFVPPGTYNEPVEVKTQGITIKGCGRSTIITGTNHRPIRLSANNITILDLSVNNENSSPAIQGVNTSQTGLHIENVNVLESGGRGFNIRASDCTLLNCRANNTADRGIQYGPNNIVSGCIVKNTEEAGITPRSNSDSSCIISNNIVINSSGNGGIRENNSGIIVGNVVKDSTVGIEASSTDSIVANNRVTNSTDSDFSDSGTNVLFAGNLSDDGTHEPLEE